jgi:serine/threonine-protein kinase RsbW
MDIRMALVLPPVAASVSLARHSLAEALRIAAVAPDCVYEAQVALSEACTNVFHHVPSGRNFEVLINVGDQELTMDILDAGPGFPRGHDLADWPEAIAENGRGIALMKAFTDHAVFESADGGGSVRLRKRLRRTADAILPVSSPSC